MTCLNAELVNICPLIDLFCFVCIKNLFFRPQGDTMIDVCIYNTEDRALATEVSSCPQPVGDTLTLRAI